VKVERESLPAGNFLDELCVEVVCHRVEDKIMDESDFGVS
jgi:hypothetical protein